MAQFRKKAVVIEATQWFKNGDHPLDGVRPQDGDELGGPEGKVVGYYRFSDNARCEQCNLPNYVHGWVDTLEAGHRVCPGDWIITGVKGERYPIKDTIFRETYDEVEE